eukprot:1196422-Prorocentrum_minimum.AAC.1
MTSNTGSPAKGLPGGPVGPLDQRTGVLWPSVSYGPENSTGRLVGETRPHRKEGANRASCSAVKLVRCSYHQPSVRSYRRRGFAPSESFSKSARSTWPEVRVQITKAHITHEEALSVLRVVPGRELLNTLAGNRASGGVGFGDSVAL